MVWLSKNFRRLKGGELRGVWQESLEKENSSQGLGDHQWGSTWSPLLLLDDFDHCWPDAWSQRWDRLLSLFLLTSSSMVLVTFGLEWGYWLNCWADFLEMGLCFHKCGWLLICWVFRNWPLGGWNTQRLTSPHRLTAEGIPPQRWDCRWWAVEGLSDLPALRLNRRSVTSPLTVLRWCPPLFRLLFMIFRP